MLPTATVSTAGVAMMLGLIRCNAVSKKKQQSLPLVYAECVARRMTATSSSIIIPAPLHVAQEGVGSHISQCCVPNHSMLCATAFPACPTQILARCSWFTQETASSAIAPGTLDNKDLNVMQANQCDRHLILHNQ